MNSHLLIVDDDEEIRTQMRWALAREHDILQAGDRLRALELFESRRPLVVLLDLGLPPRPDTPEEGLSAIADLLAIDSQIKIIVLSGQGERETAMKAIGAGAYDFLCKPVDIDELKLVLKRCFHVAHLERDYRTKMEQLTVDTFEGMLGNSAPMRSVFDAIRKVSTTDAPVLILGESGTGKEMAARAIHQRSSRRHGPFVAINCSAIPEPLLESELFGHEKGSFTGAHVQRKGRIEHAHGGTLFLDEIGEIPLAIQVKLLRFLQERSLERIGGRQEIHVDVRVVAATNADLSKAMEAGRFREDLYYRLAVVKLPLPPLRDRQDDIDLIAHAILHQYCTEIGKHGMTFSQEAIRAMVSHPWPGNVRELQNRVRRAVIMCDGKRLTSADLELDDLAKRPSALSLTLKEARENLERDLILQALRRHSGNITSTASELGVSRPTLYDLMTRLEIAKTPLEIS